MYFLWGKFEGKAEVISSQMSLNAQSLVDGRNIKGGVGVSAHWRHNHLMSLGIAPQFLTDHTTSQEEEREEE